MYKRNKLTKRSNRSKLLKQSTHLKRSSKRRHTRKNNRRHTRKSKGGSYTQQTEMTLEGVPLEKDAVVDVPGFGTMSVKEYMQYINNQDLQPHT